MTKNKKRKDALSSSPPEATANTKKKRHEDIAPDLRPETMEELRKMVQDLKSVLQTSQNQMQTIIDQQQKQIESLTSENKALKDRISALEQSRDPASGHPGAVVDLLSEFVRVMDERDAEREMREEKSQTWYYTAYQRTISALTYLSSRTFSQTPTPIRRSSQTSFALAKPLRPKSILNLGPKCRGLSKFSPIQSRKKGGL